jgi:hypothetical protein
LLLDKRIPSRRPEQWKDVVGAEDNDGMETISIIDVE